LQQNEGGTPKASEPLVLQRWQVSVTASQFGRQDIHVSKGAKGLEASAEESRLIELWKTTHTAELSPDLQNLPWAVPVPQCMNSPFGVKRFYDGVFSGNYHKGVDQKAPHGQAIHPITAGRVVMAGRYPLHGGAVALDHGSGVGSIYIHMSKVSVKVGQHVTPETVLGLVGSTGFAMGPHLHWGLYVQGVPVNPTDGWVRLKSC
jgi:lysostaphin